MLDDTDTNIHPAIVEGHEPNGIEPQPRAKGGRPKGSPNRPKLPAVVAMDADFDPIAYMIGIVRTGTIQEPDGRQTPVEMSERLKMLREVTVYLRSKAPVEMRGEIDHRHGHLHADLTAIMRDPKLAQAAEDIALALLESPDDAIALLPGGSTPDPQY